MSHKCLGNSQYGYKIGMSNPNANPVTDPYLATHHIILAHAAAAKLYKEKYQVIISN
jgi:beta-glucosidase